MPSEEKKKFVQELITRLKESPIVGLVDMHNLPAPQLQKMRAMLLKQEVSLIMSRKKLLRLALEGSNKEGIGQLAEKIKGMPALILASTNPFTLYSVIQKNKSKAPAKAGQIAPGDVVVKAGSTNFAPGPIISELAAVGIKTKVDKGKLVIQEDTTVAKEGDTITAKLAETLKRLDIKPMEIGLNLVAVWEKGTVFDARQLHIDEAEYSQNFTRAAQWAMNLAVETAYLTGETTELLLQKAFREARALAEESNVLTDLTAGEILSQAEQQANALREAARIDIPKMEIPEKTEDKMAKIEDQAEEKAKAPEKKEEVEKETGEEAEERPELKESFHPKQGRVTPEKAGELLAQLQKRGTLRED